MSENGDKEKLRQILEKIKKYPLDMWQWEGGRCSLIFVQAKAIRIEIFINYKTAFWPLILKVFNADKELLFECQVENMAICDPSRRIDEYYENHELIKFYRDTTKQLEKLAIDQTQEAFRQAEKNKKQQLEDFLKE